MVKAFFPEVFVKLGTVVEMMDQLSINRFGRSLVSFVVIVLLLDDRRRCIQRVNSTEVVRNMVMEPLALVSLAPMVHSGTCTYRLIEEDVWICSAH